MLPSLRERRARRAQARFFATFCVAFIVLFVSWALFFHLSTVLPNTAPSGGSGSAGWGSWSQELWWAAHLLVCLWLFQGGTASYLSTFLSSPGYAERLEEEVAKQQHDHLLLQQQQQEQPPRLGQRFSKWCHFCQQPKLGRTHHCKSCDRCVVKMDHHCPWIGNCVGQDNHRHFIMFLFYLWLSSFYGFVHVLPLFFEGLFEGQEDKGKMNVHLSFQQITLSMGLNLSTTVAVSILLIVQAFLISTGQTSVEWNVNRARRRNALKEGQPFVNPYDFGLRRNWKLLFGQWRYKLSALLPLDST